MQEMYKPSPEKIRTVLENKKKVTKEEIVRILSKAKSLEELSLDEVFTLLRVEGNKNLTDKIFLTASEIRDNVIGRVIYLPVPLYVSNYCQNNCEYCSLRVSNKIPRKRLNERELVEEVKGLTSYGFRIIELVFGEDTFFTTKKIAEYVKIGKKELSTFGEIVLNLAPVDTEGFKRIRYSGVDRIVQWQETYDQERYSILHPDGNKRDFDFRVQAYERMLNAGIKNVGIGVLFGLADYRYDVLSLIHHMNHLRSKYEISPIIGIPRLKSACTPYIAGKFEVTDEQLKLAVAVYRLAFPYSNIFISTRENMNMMVELLNCGGGSLLASKCSVNVGYKKNGSAGQFEVNSYEPDKVVELLKEKGFVPSFKIPLYNLV